MVEEQTASFEQLTDLETTTPTLIEGLPGLGLVASIAVEQLTNQLDLVHHGTIHSPSFPKVAAFDAGRVQDPVRVYAGDNPDVLTLQSAFPIPEAAFSDLGSVLLDQLALEFDRAIFLAGIPAEAEEEIGEVQGVATTDDLADDLARADIPAAEGTGLVGGVTGSLVTDCYNGGVPAALLLVKSNPYIPDPTASRAVIEEALEPLVDFDIETTELRDHAERIQRQKGQIARQLRRQQGEEADEEVAKKPGMYQ